MSIIKKYVPKFIINFFLNLESFIENKFCFFVARRLRYLLFPLRYLVLKFNIVFVWNVAEGSGHIVSDIDNFLRKKKLGLIDKKKKYVFVRKSSSYLSYNFLKAYPDLFSYGVTNSFIYYLALPLILSFEELSIDVGLSRLKISLNRKDSIKLDSNLWQISKKDGYKQWLDYLELRNRSDNYIPLRRGKFDKKILYKLNLINNKYILIHIKTNVMNATAKAGNIKDFLPTINYFLNNSYKVVMIGPELKSLDSLKMLNNPNFINYGNSNHQSFYNDLILFRYSFLSIVSGSGIGWLADVMNKPMIYTNYWHLATPPYNKYIINLPTLVKSKTNNKFLKFKDQYYLYLNKLKDVGPELFPHDKYIPVNPSAEQLLDASIECINNIEFNVNKPSTNHVRFNNIDSNGYSKFIKSRISENFLKTNNNLL